MSHLCRRVPCEQATCSPGGREQRCCLFVTVLCLRVCRRLRSSPSAWDQNLDYTQLWRSSEKSESSAGRGKYLGQSIRVNIITGSDFQVARRKVASPVEANFTFARHLALNQTQGDISFHIERHHFRTEGVGEETD